MEWIRTRYRSLDAERAIVIAFWSQIIQRALELGSTGEPALAAQRKHVLDRATWAVTEVRPGAEWKLFRQRFWSKNALDWAEATLPALSTQTDRDEAAEAELRHEHVQPRAGVLLELISSRGELGVIAATLRALDACVVTKAEAKKLNRSRAEGWARYADKRVVVIDVETGTPHPLPEKPDFAAERGRGPSDVAEETLQVMEDLLDLDGEEVFARLHHFGNTFERHWDYCQKKAVHNEGSNADTLQRVKFAIEHFREHGDWEAAVRLAWEAVPRRR